MALRIAHSNIKAVPDEAPISGQEVADGAPAIEWAKEGYDQAIIKNADLIAEIQLYFPKWMPEFRYPY